MRKYMLLVALICIVIIAGCVGQSNIIGGGLVVSMSPDPRTVFSSGDVRVNFDMDNENPREVTNIIAQIYDAGILSTIGNTCELRTNSMSPHEFKTFFCSFRAPPKSGLGENEVNAEIKGRVEYTTDLPIIQVVEMMTEDEYTQRSESGKLQKKPATYSYRDSNVEVFVEFSEEMPLVVRDGREYYMYFTIRNIGNGFIKEISRGDFVVNPLKPGPKAFDCPDINAIGWKIQPQGKEFPRIACHLILPQGFSVVENYGIGALLKYRYEVRQTTNVRVVK